MLGHAGVIAERELLHDAVETPSQANLDEAREQLACEPRRIILERLRLDHSCRELLERSEVRWSDLGHGAVKHDEDAWVGDL
jgi:hypothetical protein